MKKKAAKKPPHECRRDIDAKLSEHNTQLDYAIAMDGKTYFKVATYKVDAKKRMGPKTVVATFCPFCGVKME